MYNSKHRQLLLAGSLLIFTILKTYTISQDESFILITMLYNETNPERAQEYLTTLDKNLSNAHIEKIDVLYDVSRGEGQLYAQLLKRPISITHIQGHLSFGALFNRANELYPKRKIIISNADIYFDGTLGDILEPHLINTVLALSRLNPSGKGWKIEGVPTGYSQDCWMFLTPLKQIPEADNIRMGTFCCEGKLAYNLDKAGLRVLNPCLSINCFHVHQVRIRTWTTHTVRDPRRAVPWCRLPDPYIAFSGPELFVIPPFIKHDVPKLQPTRPKGPRRPKKKRKNRSPRERRHRPRRHQTRYTRPQLSLAIQPHILHRYLNQIDQVECE